MAAALASLCFLVGLTAITVGSWMVSEAAGLIVGGAFAVAGAWYFRKGLDGPARPTP